MFAKIGPEQRGARASLLVEQEPGGSAAFKVCLCLRRMKSGRMMVSPKFRLRVIEGVDDGAMYGQDLIEPLILDVVVYVL